MSVIWGSVCVKKHVQLGLCPGRSRLETSRGYDGHQVHGLSLSATEQITGNSMGGSGLVMDTHRNIRQEGCRAREEQDNPQKQKCIESK